MRAVVEELAAFQNAAFDVVHRQAAPEHVMLGDEHDKRFGNLLRIGALVGPLGVEQAAVQPCALFPCTPVVALDLNVVQLAAVVGRQNVQTQLTLAQIRNVHLGTHLEHLQIGLIQQDAQHQLGALRMVIKAGVHKIIIYQTERLDPLQILPIPRFKPWYLDHTHSPPPELIYLFDFIISCSCALFKKIHGLCAQPAISLRIIPAMQNPGYRVSAVSGVLSCVSFYFSLYQPKKFPNGKE